MFFVYIMPSVNPRRTGAFVFAILASSVVSAAPLELAYWEKWTLFEGDAMKAVVEDFNNLPEVRGRLHVTYLPVSNVEQKVLVATAGGDPPDIAGLYDAQVVSFADKNALLQLDDFCARAGIKAEDFIPVFWNQCVFRGHVWALPTTPATIALHWNKAMFRKAGLDPEKPPRTIAELDAMADRLTIKDKSGHLVQMGFIPWEPGWWNWAWVKFFGGRLWDGESRITCDEPECVAAFKWVESYGRKYGKDQLQVFTSGFGNFASPQNAFMAGKVAMEIQGVWMYNFISQYAPKMEWGAAPFPTAKPELYGISDADLDNLVIPADARHPAESFEFIRYVMTQPAMEKLCLGHRKFSPLTKVSPGFWAKSLNPYIRMFDALARNPRTFAIPHLTIWQEYAEELNVAFQKVYLLEETPEVALGKVKARMQKRLDRELRRMKRLGLSPT